MTERSLLVETEPFAGIDAGDTIKRPDVEDARTWIVDAVLPERDGIYTRLTAPCPSGGPP